ncbi:unnamed protein product, partial [Mesorhabditis belari]|uniref:Transcription factor AP-2 C-terminal domain-containing protein n=1 Tax=Mesorhabditis belari TaxID=2138241 RepID=A0AAF3EDF0_9BILA
MPKRAHDNDQDEDHPEMKLPKTPALPEHMEHYYNNPLFSTPINDPTMSVMRAFIQPQFNYSPIEADYSMHQMQETHAPMIFRPKNELLHGGPSTSHPCTDSGNVSDAEETDSEGYDEEDMDDKNNGTIDKSNVYMQVTGRLSLMGVGGKFDVTLDEIRRRIGQPECLNSSILAAMLRKAKTANNGKGMREELAAHGIELPVGRRKQGVTTALTALLEGEATHLARDLDKITASSYPINTLAEHLRNKLSQGTHHEVETRRRDLLGANRILREMGDVIFRIECPIGDHNPPPFHDETLQLAFNHYSLITHGFGVFNQRTWIRQFAQLTHLIYTSMTPPPMFAPPPMPTMYGPPPTHLLPPHHL